MWYLKIAAVVAAATVAGCGGAEGPVPDVVGDRLDVAKSEMKDAGYDTEEIGGGTFGIVAESNWTVCETDPAAGSTGSDKVKLIVDRTCPDADTTAEEEEPSEEPLPAEEEPTDTSSPSSGSGSKRIRVPDVVGMNHQAAQNRMQDAGLYMLDEEDATGQDRLLLYDRNWVVVSQSPRPGARVGENRTIVLRSKKIGE